MARYVTGGIVAKLREETSIERLVEGSRAEFTTDYYLVDAGIRVLSLNFKVLTSHYPDREPVFARVVDSLSLEA